MVLPFPQAGTTVKSKGHSRNHCSESEPLRTLRNRDGGINLFPSSAKQTSAARTAVPEGFVFGTPIMLLRHALLSIISLSTIAAYAAEVGECAAPADMTAKLKAEDQHSIATADMLTNDKRLFGMIFTMSADRKVGYILKSDQPLGDRAGTFCVYERMADMRLYDARVRGVPPAALLRASDEDAIANCKRQQATGKFPAGNCGSINQLLRRVEPLGERVMIQGLVTTKGPKGYQLSGGLVTVSGNVTGSINDDPQHPSRGIVGGIAYSSLPDGATLLDATLTYPRYTEYGLAALK